jgi:hypothetical protein
VGHEICCDSTALGERVGGVHTVSRLRHRDPAGDLLDQRHRYLESLLDSLV